MLIRHSTTAVDFSGPEPLFKEVDVLYIKLTLTGQHKSVGHDGTYIDMPLEAFLLLLDRARSFNELRGMLEGEAISCEPLANAAAA